MESGFPSDGCISTLHLWAEQGGAELSADNIEEFLGNARLSRRISALEVVVKCVRGGNAIRDVRLIFGVAASRIEVKGENRDWMDDVLQLVQGFLVTRRPRYWQLCTTPAFALLVAVSATCGCLLVSQGLAMVQSSGSLARLAAGAALLLCALPIGWYAPRVIGTAFPRSVLTTAPNSPSVMETRVWGVLSIVFAFTIATLFYLLGKLHW